MTTALAAYVQLECPGSELRLGDTVLAIDGRDVTGTIVDDHGFLCIGAWRRPYTGGGLDISPTSTYLVLRQVADAVEAQVLLTGTVGAPTRHSPGP